MICTHYRKILLLLIAISCKGYFASAATVALPDLGDPSSAIISPQQEYRTGQRLLKAIYQQLPTSEDPLIYDYLQTLTSRLVFNSPLKLKSFNLVVINSQEFNAFAAPGNIMGINIGLLLYANSEDELSSVITHEIGHLSQRHYTRSLERRKSQSLISLASFIGGLLIMASGQADAGLATMTAGQAAAIDQQLKYSRQDEQEADRIGIDTLYRAGMNPVAAANMFQHMQTSIRYRDDVKAFSFLLTHPLTESRIADAINQARLYPLRNDQDSFEFHLMKARAYVLNAKNPKLAIKFFKDSASIFARAQEYGLALAYLADKAIKHASPIINKLYNASPQRPPFILAKTELLLAENNTKGAIALLKKHLAISPDQFSMNMALAKAYQKDGQMLASANILESIIAMQSHTPAYIWHLLAETQGQAGNIKGVHKARAEYFIAIGAFKDAQRHLKLALPMEKGNRQATAKIRARIEEVKVLEKEKDL